MTRARDLSQVLNDVGSISTNDIANGAVTQVKLDSNINLGVRVASVAYPGDDTAADPAGGQTITITGAGFASTPTVYVDTTIAPSVTYVSPTQITFVSPAKSAGTYNLFVINPDGSTAIHVMGMSYSGVPSWTTPAGSLGSVNAAAISIQLVATGDTPLVYTLTSGSSLPAGVTLSSSGLISGSVPTAQTFSFSVDVTDPQYQTTPRSFSITVTVGDAYFQYVTLLLHGNQPSGVTDTNNNVFKDSSANNFTITRPVGANTTQGTFSPFSKVDGRWGTYFPGAGDYLTVPASSNLEFGSGDFTIEFWWYPASTGRQFFYHGSIGSDWSIGIDYSSDYSNQKMGVWASSNGSSWNIFNSDPGGNGITGTVVPQQQWNHFAWTRSGSTWRAFLNGTQVWTGTSSATIVDRSGSAKGIGTWYAGNNQLLGAYLTNFRIVKGTAVYTSNFTVPTSPLTAITNTQLLTCQSNRFKDNSTNNFTITRNGNVAVSTFSPFPTTSAYSAGTNGGSGYFDGTGDFLTASYSTSSFDWWTGDYTLEAWVYPTSLSGWSYVDGPNAVPTLIGNSTTTSTPSYFSFGPMSDGSVMLRYWNGSATNAVASSAGLVRVNQWNHIEFTKSSSGIRVGVNGTSTSASAVSGTPQSSSSLPLTIGQINNTAINGYVSGLRIVKGTALYDATTYTVPTSSPTAISNTNLLLNFTNGGIIDNSMFSNLETVNQAEISTAQSKWGGASIYFDGTDDNILIPYNPVYSLGTGDFTVEGWFYFTNISTTARGIVALGDGANGGGPYSAWSLRYFGSEGSNQIGFSRYDGTSYDYITSGFTISANTWYHIAVARASGTLKIFVNGTSYYSNTVTTNFNAVNTNPMRIGLQYYGPAGGYGGPRYWGGYIDDLRITKGYARYTSNFSVPTGPFEDNGV